MTMQQFKCKYQDCPYCLNRECQRGATASFGRCELDGWLLMYKDIPVVGFDKGLQTVTTIHANYLPYGLRPQATAIALYQWIANRATPLTRKNVEFLYMLMGKSRTTAGQQETVQEFGGVSVNDCFWIRAANEDIKWEQISPFTSGLKWSENDRAFGYGILTGTVSDALRPARFSPEITLQGNWSKCLKRDDKGILLYKANDDDEREIEVTEFGKALNLDIVGYWAEDYEDVSCTVCRIECSENTQWISAEEIGVSEAAQKYPEAYSTMQTFDYIVGNSDRHSLNWGWVVNAELIPQGLTPLYDFNFSLMGVKVVRPDKVDLSLVERAQEYLARNPKTPNAGYYAARLIELLNE